MNQTSIQNVIGGAIFGGIGGAVAGLFAIDFWGAFYAGGCAGGVIAFIWGMLPRTFEMPRIAVESFGTAGWIGAIVASVIFDAGYLGGFISCGVGYVAGMFLPAAFIASSMDKRD